MMKTTEVGKIEMLNTQQCSTPISHYFDIQNPTVLVERMIQICAKNHSLRKETFLMDYSLLAVRVQKTSHMGLN